MTSRREVKGALARLEVEVAGGHVGASDPTVRQLLSRWMDHLVRLGRSESTLYGYAGYINRELVPAIGDVRLSKLTARHLDALYSALTKRGLAPATVRQIHALVRAALNQAVRWGLVGRNVAQLASAPSQPQREQSPPTAAQVQALIKAGTELDPMFGLYVRVVAATGMRRSEACGPRWSDTDLRTGRLTVARSHVSLPGVVGDRPTKTRSARSIALDEGTADALRSGWRTARQLARFAGVDDETRRAGYIFSFEVDGARAWRGDTVTARWERVRRAAGVTGVRLHDLRHWQATQLLDAGVPVPTVAARLGHADGTTTIDRAHPSPAGIGLEDMHREQHNEIDRMLDTLDLWTTWASGRPVALADLTNAAEVFADSARRAPVLSGNPGDIDRSQWFELLEPVLQLLGQRGVTLSHDALHAERAERDLGLDLT